MRPGFRMWAGSKASLIRRDNAASGAGCGSNTATARRSAGAALTSVAWPAPLPLPLPSAPRIVDFEKKPAGTAPNGEKIDTPFYVIHYDFVLQKAAKAAAA